MFHWGELVNDPVMLGFIETSPLAAGSAIVAQLPVLDDDEKIFASCSAVKMVQALANSWHSLFKAGVVCVKQDGLLAVVDATDGVINELSLMSPPAHSL